MDEIAKKVSAYDFLNIMIPGGMLVYSLGLFGFIEFEAGGSLFLIVLAFVLGLIGSRIGSLILEPIALKCDLVKRDYAKYIEAEREDGRLTTLATISNMYRTLAGSMVVLAILGLGTLVPDGFRTWLYIGYGAASFFLFFCGWIKQEKYIDSRIDLCRRDEHDNR